ncbi:hypothetical protein COOONC_03202, partial [Cooperia oncophora]
LPNRYSTSPDNISYVFLKRAALGLAKPLTLLFNCPDIWKTGLVKPVHKKGSRNVVHNYRPICLTSGISEVMERIICSSILTFVLENNILNSAQHGFLSKRSTTTALLSFRGGIGSWTEGIIKHSDSIPISLLLKKSEGVGITGCLPPFY